MSIEEEYQEAFNTLHMMLENPKNHTEGDVLEAFIKKEKLRRRVENDGTENRH